MSKIVTIPDCMSPFTVVVNNKAYTYTSGKQVEVPDEVAEIIKMHMDAHEAATAPLAPPVSGGGGLSLEEYVSTDNITHIDLPNATRLRGEAFVGNSDIKTINMPNVTSIGDYAFQNCDSLALTSLPEGLKTIGLKAFMYCTTLALTSLPSGITSIGIQAFYRCSGLKSITFKGKPSTIGEAAFASCDNLATINVPWAEGEVAGAPWGATNATINYNYTGE